MILVGIIKKSDKIVVANRDLISLSLPSTYRALTIIMKVGNLNLQKCLYLKKILAPEEILENEVDHDEEVEEGEVEEEQEEEQVEEEVEEEIEEQVEEIQVNLVKFIDARGEK